MEISGLDISCFMILLGSISAVSPSRLVWMHDTVKPRDKYHTLTSSLCENKYAMQRILCILRNEQLIQSEARRRLQGSRCPRANISILFWSWL